MSEMPTDILDKILSGVDSETATLQLPDSDLRNFYRDENYRLLWLDDEVDDYSLKLAEKIMQYNREDKEIPVEERTPIKLFINSPGGSVAVMWSLIQAIKMSKTPVWTINWCNAMSAACAIFAAGHKRLAMPGSTFLIHSGSCGYVGNAEQVDNAKKYYDTLGKKADDELLASTEIDPKVFKKKKVTDWYISAEEALEMKLADKIVESYDEIM